MARKGPRGGKRALGRGLCARPSPPSASERRKSGGRLVLSLQCVGQVPSRPDLGGVRLPAAGGQSPQQPARRARRRRRRLCCGHGHMSSSRRQAEPVCFQFPSSCTRTAAPAASVFSPARVRDLLPCGPARPASSQTRLMVVGAAGGKTPARGTQGTMCPSSARDPQPPSPWLRILQPFVS